MIRREANANPHPTIATEVVSMHAAKRLLVLVVLGCCALLASAASASAALPTLVNNAGTGLTDTTATVNGTVKTDSALSDCHFEYVSPTAYAATGFANLSSGGMVACAQAVPADSVNHPVSATIPVPSPGAPVYYRLAATNATGPAVAPNHGGLGFGVVSFDGEALQKNGESATQAGSHPASAATSFYLSNTFNPAGLRYGTQDLRDVTVDLPPGLIGNPRAVSTTCPIRDLRINASNGTRLCPPASQVGVLTIWQDGVDPGSGKDPTQLVPFMSPLYLMDPPQGTVALLGTVVGIPVLLPVELRSDGDYGIAAVSTDIQQTISIEGVTTEVWGVPADPSHDGLRDNCIGNASGLPTGKLCPSPDAANPKAFFTLPTSCTGPAQTGIDVAGWAGGQASSSFLSHAKGEPLNPIGNSGCNTLDFSPSLEARPTTNVADSASGLDVDLHIPQEDITDPSSTAEAHLKDTTVTLPEGLTVNPSGANGLAACSPSQIGLTTPVGQAGPVHFTANPAQCPDASKLGTVEVDTPLLDHPLPGAAYIATPYDNPFGSLIALYVTIDDPVSGVVVKLPGEVHADPVTGQLTATFEENPQLPFEDFKLHFFGGAGGSLRTPSTCGTYSTTSSLTPWSAPDSGPPATPSDTWAIEQAADGGACPTDPGGLAHTPSFDAGTISPIAGAESPIVMNLRRNDGTQQFSAISLTPPQGLVAKLANIPYCPEAALQEAAAKSGRAEEATPSCPAASQVGTVVAAAGAGPAPYNAPGRAYLTGPYKGAPISLAIVTPATAGPFDLGTIVVRTALYVNRTTAQISAISDPLPTILQGIPLDVRSVQVKLDHAGWGINPTSCDPMSFGGQLTSTLGLTTPLQSRFQVGECGRLSFKPQLSLNLKGGTKRGKYPALTATLTMPGGSANLAAISVALPHSEFLAQEHIGTVCTRVQFAADQCPPESIYGTATVNTPLLGYPLTGNVYLRSSSNKLPDLVPDLRGPDFQPIELEADGRTDSVNGGIRNTFDFVPDAPFTSFTLALPGGKKGLLLNSTNICAKPQRATVNYTAHNGATLEAHPLLKASCPKKHKKAKRAKRRQRHARR